MARKESRVRRVMLTQQLRPELFSGWSDAEKATLGQGAQQYGQVIQDKLDDAGLAVSSMYAITHDKDQYREWDEAKNDYQLVVKPQHMHVVIEFLDGVESTISAISRAVGVTQNMLEKGQRGRNAGDNMRAYLIHAKDSEKYQYSPDEVATIEGEDYRKIFARRRESWEKGRATKHKANSRKKEDVEFYLLKVLHGEISKSEILVDDDLYAIYSYNKSKFDEAFATYAERRAQLAARKLEAGEFSTTILFVTGRPGAGKTAWVKNALIPRVIDTAREHGERWEYYTGGATNPLDDWHGEEVLLLDDVRASAMDATDWLLLLDPHQTGTASARYHNKTNVAPRVIVLTAYKNPNEFFNYVPKSGGGEALDQFIRRLSAIIKVQEYDWNENKGTFLIDEVGKSKPYNHQHERGSEVVWSPMNHGSVARWNVENEDALSVVVGLLMANSKDLIRDDEEIKVPVPSAVLAKYDSKPTKLMKIMSDEWNKLALMRHMSDEALSQFMNDLGVFEQVGASDILGEQMQYEEDNADDPNVLKRGLQNALAVPMTPEQEKRYQEEMDKINDEKEERLKNIANMISNHEDDDE